MTLKQSGSTVVLMMILAISYSSTFGQGEKVLVRISQSNLSSASVAESRDFKICLQTDTYCLATIDRDDLQKVEASGVSFEVLDPEAWTEPYFLVTRPHYLPPKEIGASAAVIHREDGETIVKMSETQSLELAKQGFQLARIFETKLPLHARETPVFRMPSQNARVSDLIQELVDAVSDSAVRAYLQRLQDFRTRYSFSDSITEARNWLQNRFQEFGYSDVRFDPFVIFGTSAQNNVVATKTGSQGTDRVIIIGGHYDSIVGDLDPMDIAPGVDDNGTGTAGTLEVARVLAGTDLETTVLFVPFAAEELGLLGSRHFAQSAFNQGMNIDIMFNMDMIGNVADNVPDFNVLTDNRSRVFAQLTAAVAQQYTNLQPVIAASSGNSDHFYFQNFGFPALFLQEGDFSPNWHRRTDTIDNINVSYAATVIKAALATLVTVANSPARPRELAAIELGDGSSQALAWRGNTEPDLAGYRLYFGSSSGNYTTMREVAAPFDTLRGLAENVPVFASVTAFDDDGNESLLSPEISFVPRSLPVAPAGLEATSARTRIELRWEANNHELDFTGYKVTRLGPGSSQRDFSLDAGVTQFVDETAQPHVLYRYAIQALDRDGNESAPSAFVRGQLATHDRGIFVLDGTKDSSGRPLQPTDQEVDDYFDSMLQGFNHAGQWDLADSMNAGVKLSDADLAIYSTVVWHAEVTAPQRSISADTSALKKYLKNGGKLVLSGWSLADNLSEQTSSQKVFSPGEFVYDYLKIESALTGAGADRDFIGADAAVAGYPNVTVDAAKAPSFGGNLIAMEIFTSLAGGSETEVLYNYRSSLIPPSSKHGMPVAFRHLSDELKLVVINFPLYFMEAAAAEQILSQALTDLGEISTSVEERGSSSANVSTFELGQSYPNPFSLNRRRETNSALINYQVPAESKVQIRIYNVLGQLVRTLVDSRIAAGEHATSWDGRSNSGALVPAGLYFYEIRAGKFTQVRKMLVVR